MNIDVHTRVYHDLSVKMPKSRDKLAYFIQQKYYFVQLMPATPDLSRISGRSGAWAPPGDMGRSNLGGLAFLPPKRTKKTFTNTQMYDTIIMKEHRW